MCFFVTGSIELIFIFIIIFFEVINIIYFGKQFNKNYFIIVNSSFILLLVVSDRIRMLIK